MLSLSFLLALILSYGINGLVIRRGLLAEVNERSNHQVPTPQGGGIGILAGLALGLILIPHLWPPAPVGRVLIIALDAMALLGFISWLNDRREIRATYRLLAQFICVGGTTGAAIYYFMGHLPIPFWGFALGWAITTLAWMWFVNLYNFMDGTDGIMGVETISIAAGVLLITQLTESPIPYYLVPLLGATIGFLFLNWPKAKLFAGDVGSIPLGFILGYALISLAHISPAAAFILPLYFVADASFTLVKRILRREKIMQAHSDHFFQQAVRKGFSHKRVAVTVAALNAVLIGLSVLTLSEPVSAIILALLAVAAVMWHFKKP